MKDIAYSEKKIIIDYLKINDYVAANNKYLLGELGNCSKRKLQRLLNFLTDSENILYKDDTSKPYKYRLKDKKFILEVLSSREAIDIDYALETSSKYFTADTHNLIKKIFNSNPNIVSGYLPAMEELKDNKISQTYNKLLEVVEKGYYVNLTYKPATVYREVKCIRIVFIENNWYIAFAFFNTEKKTHILKLGRLSFIKRIELLSEKPYSQKNRFQKTSIKQYQDFLNNLQNAFTLYRVKPKSVKLTVASPKAHYFEPNMKKFLKSQKFIRKLSDGSIVFSLEYTQPMEILPFIQEWMPHIVPEEGEIRDLFLKNVEKAKKCLM